MMTDQVQNKDVAIRVSNLSKTYKLYGSAKDRLKEAFHPFKKQYHHTYDALQNVSLEIQKGETIGIIGRNGSGKSTLLQCICGIVNASQGEVQVSGKIAALLELGAGFNPEFTGRENLYLNASILGLSREQTEDRLQDILSFADIGEYIDQPVRTYSSGMYVRLAFSIAIHVDPEILIVDEALAVGDIHFQSKCFERFHKFREQGVTVIFVTHDLNMVTRYCDRAYLLAEGQLQSQGVPREVVSKYRKTTAKHDSAESGKQAEETRQTEFENNPYEMRYGDNKAEILEAGLYQSNGQASQILHFAESFQVKLRVAIHAEIPEALFAFTIKDVKGTELAGTNTHLEKIDVRSVQPGEVVDVIFNQKMLLTAGSYLLSVGCVSLVDDNIEVHDRRHDFLSFDVVSERLVLGHVDLQSEISVTYSDQASLSEG